MARRNCLLERAAQATTKIPGTKKSPTGRVNAAMPSDAPPQKPRLPSPVSRLPSPVHKQPRPQNQPERKPDLGHHLVGAGNQRPVDGGDRPGQRRGAAGQAVTCFIDKKGRQRPDKTLDNPHHQVTVSKNAVDKGQENRVERRPPGPHLKPVPVLPRHEPFAPEQVHGNLVVIRRILRRRLVAGRNVPQPHGQGHQKNHPPPTPWAGRPPSPDQIHRAICHRQSLRSLR